MQSMDRNLHYIGSIMSQSVAHITLHGHVVVYEYHSVTEKSNLLM